MIWFRELVAGHRQALRGSARRTRGRVPGERARARLQRPHRQAGRQDLRRSELAGAGGAGTEAAGAAHRPVLARRRAKASPRWSRCARPPSTTRRSSSARSATRSRSSRTTSSCCMSSTTSRRRRCRSRQIRDRVAADFDADRAREGRQGARRRASWRARSKGETSTASPPNWAARSPTCRTSAGRRRIRSWRRWSTPRSACRARSPASSEFALAKLGPTHYALVGVTAVKDGDLTGLDDATRAEPARAAGQARGAVEARAYIAGAAQAVHGQGRRRPAVTGAQARKKPGDAGLFFGGQRPLHAFDAGHAEHVVAGVDVGDLAGDAGGQVRAQERGDVADVLDRDAAAQRRVLLDVA